MEQHLESPYKRALITIAGIAGFSLLLTITIWGLSSIGLIPPALIPISGIFFGVFSLFLFIVWVLGMIQIRRVKAFLKSDRPLVQWTYSQAEWEQSKKMHWQEEKGDWKITFGCLAILFALAGTLTGILVGWEDGFADVFINSLIGLIFGGLTGVVLGILVAAGNHLGARQSYQDSKPGHVALGIDEVYVNSNYFKGNGRNSYIQKAKLCGEDQTTLELLLIFPPRPRMGNEEKWIIPIPDKWVAHVAELLPRLTPHRE